MVTKFCTCTYLVSCLHVKGPHYWQQWRKPVHAFCLGKQSIGRSRITEVTKHKWNYSTQGTKYTLQKLPQSTTLAKQSSNKTKHFHRANVFTVQMFSSSFTARGHCLVQEQHFLIRAANQTQDSVGTTAMHLLHKPCSSMC